jgi:hypothetical protein
MEIARVSMRTLLFPAALCWLAAVAGHLAPASADGAPAGARTQDVALFATSDDCMACHNGLLTPSGEDVSIGVAWRASMMANSARDPYWQAAVRREVIDHPAAAAGIEDECAVCHMPMARTSAHARGREGQVFANLAGDGAAGDARLAADGVSCTLCHQITAANLGTRASFSGGYAIDTVTPAEQRPLFGPFPVDPGRMSVMHSATGFRQREAAHVRDSAMCATCHTLYTKARGPKGEVIGELPEQMPFQEWQHSAYRDERSCQSCHMPVVREPVAIASVLGEPRDGLARHTFVGGNFFMLRMLNRYRSELGVPALPQELEAAAHAAADFLRNETATLTIARGEVTGGRLTIDLAVENLTGHKLPTAYPSRRAWIRLAVRDRGGALVFASGAHAADGSIEGNDNDADARRFEPHYREITRPDQVQIYESIMGDAAGGVTTGLLSAVRYLKDNRLLPRGFDKATAHADIAVHGDAAGDEDFRDGGDRIRYVVDVAGRTGPYAIDVELRYQPVAFRWAQNLKRYDAGEPRRFVAWFDAMAQASSALVARAGLTVP